MRRRRFHQLSGLCLAGLGLPGPGATRSSAPWPPGARGLPSVGTNLSGMEWARPGLRYGLSSMPNLHFTVPRRAEVAYLAGQGFLRNRLPIQWELLQPMLCDTPADARARSVIGQPGAFHTGYAAFITEVLDAHAAVGAHCVIDLHNYGRYQDFRWQSDGSVIGLEQPADPLLRPYTSERSQVQERLMALAPGATLTVTHFTDFWSRAARLWRMHPGLGGYGLMNEPHDLPAPGGTVSAPGREDLGIWPQFAQAAIRAIRALDPVHPIYVAGNSWSSALSLPTRNPDFPLEGEGLIYEAHLYLDALSNGHAFDFDTEVARHFSAGSRGRALHLNAGVERLRQATDWAQAQGLRLALTEIGMPIDDPRWQDMFERTLAHARLQGMEVYSWMGGSHWPIRNHALNHVPGWYQNRTLEPGVAGPLKAAAGIAKAALFDVAQGHAPPGQALQVTVFARGHLAEPLRLRVSASAGGRLSKTELLIPAGANGEDRYDFTPAPNAVSTLSYACEPPRQDLPPLRRVYSLADPVAHARLHLADAALALLARYRACKWEMADGHTDHVMGRPARDGEPLRAVADSGFGSGPGNAMDMLNWVNRDGPGSGRMSWPVMRHLQGLRASEHSGAECWGLWCKKSAPRPGVQARPRNRVPFDLEDAHFAIVALSLIPPGTDGVLFQASQAEARHCSEIRLWRGQPQLRFVDARGQTVRLTSPRRLRFGEPAVITLTSASGAQCLRVNTEEVARSAARFAPSVFAQLLIGWGFLHYVPEEGFRGHVYSVIAGPGVPGSAELEVLERYLARTAGLGWGA